MSDKYLEPQNSLQLKLKADLKKYHQKNVVEVFEGKRKIHKLP